MMAAASPSDDSIAPVETPLARELREIIASEGPISVARYMALCLQHPRHGYYMTREAIGRAGDFITAPEVDQMFGELIGLWVAHVWMSMGAPDVFRLVELGPGRGTLMADALRATAIVRGFGEAVRVELVETSPRLEASQRRALSGATRHIAWHRNVGDVPEGPAIIVANEFFDALPVHHYVRGPRGWHERLVGIAPDGSLSFGAAPEVIDLSASGSVPGQLLEIGHTAARAMSELAERVVAHGGAILVCDYGHAETGRGETLQAMRDHAFADVLTAPGEADLTVHVDFAALSRAANAAGAATYGPIPQGAFLKRLGIAERAAALRASADARQAASIDAALSRFTSPDSSMATLFKVLAVTSKGLPVPPGFEVAA